MLFVSFDTIVDLARRNDRLSFHDLRARLPGKLSNGMSYYVRANRQPRERAELRIAIKV